MNLKHLTDDTLLKDMKFLAARERNLLTQVLWHIKEIDDRKLYCDLKYSSLYEFCVRELGYSEAAAQRRISSARALERMPELELKINDGSLNLSTIALVVAEFKDHTKQREVFAEVENKTAREAADHIANIKKQPPIHWIKLDRESYELLVILKGLWPGKDVVKESLRCSVTSASEVKRKHPLRKHVNGETCSNCGTTHNLEIDHILPKAMGGTNEKNNLRILCRPCNQRAAVKQGLTMPRAGSTRPHH